LLDRELMGLETQRRSERKYVQTRLG